MTAAHIKLTYLLGLLTIFATTSECNKRMTQNPMALLQSMLSPNSEALQMLKYAAARKNCRTPCLTEEMLAQNRIPRLAANNMILTQNYPAKMIETPKRMDFPPCQKTIDILQSIPYKLEMPVQVPVMQNVPVQIPVTQNVPVIAQNGGCSCGVPSCAVPERMVNPFLPAASPVSAIAPTVSNMYPPASPSYCKCNFLRKIPIPPPTI